MTLTPAQWMEFIFDIAYLICIYALVILMSRRMRGLADPKGLPSRFRNGFLLLAVGDTGHVGFRAVAYARGGLGNNALLVGLGALATAVTVTILYVILVDIWRIRFGKKRGLLYWLLLAVAAVRLIIMCFPQNRWGSVVPPEGWFLARNIPLMVLGLSVAVLILIDARKAKDAAFTAVAALIFVSYAFYTPVILFVSRAPWVGMLMIPKTLAYLAMAWVGLTRLYGK
jgi:hypothetical protein